MAAAAAPNSAADSSPLNAPCESISQSKYSRGAPPMFHERQMNEIKNKYIYKIFFRILIQSNSHDKGAAVQYVGT